METVHNGPCKDQVRGESKAKGHWRDQVRGDRTERPIERPVVWRQYRMATLETR